MIVRVLSVVLLFALMVSGAAAEGDTNICAAPKTHSLDNLLQNDSACIALDAVTAARDACAGMSAGQVCLGVGDVQAEPNGGLIVAGAAVDLAEVDRLASSAGSLALVSMQADLPDDAEPVQLVLYGDASITNAVTDLPEPFPTATVRNGPANILNLRATPDTDAEVVTTMRWSEELTADGRSAAGDWLRVQTDKGAAWVFAQLVTVTEGDASALFVLDSPATRHMQSITLENGAACGGLLVQAGNSVPVNLEVNGALLTVSTAALLLRAPAGEPLSIQVLGGSTVIAAHGEAVEVNAGAQVNVTDDAINGVDGFSFTAALSTPLDLLPEASQACIAGLTDGTATLSRTPGGEASGELSGDYGMVVTGQTTVDGEAFWRVGTDWVAQSDVQTAGICTAVPQVSPAAAQQQISQPPQTTFARDQLPEGRSIWVAHTGPDNLSGVCTSPPIAQCDHLAAVTTQPDGTIAWLGQEPLPYTLRPSGDNSFSFSGRNQLNNANLSLTVTFTSQTTWVGTMRIVYDSDPGCTHQFNYTAELR
ncbi:MAG: SH3 domain-containing protein [Anaerolineae bacterium]|nr:SH3 domain-containing protein [Anaerolineae bacterium]